MYYKVKTIKISFDELSPAIQHFLVPGTYDSKMKRNMEKYKYTNDLK